MSKDKKKDRSYLETSHRVLEVIMGDGKSIYYPQKKILWALWRPIMDPDWAKEEPFKFDNLDRANAYLRDRQMAIKGKKVVKKKSHPFKLIFETLKKSYD